MAGQRCQVCGGKVVNGRCSLCGMPYRNDEVLYHLNEPREIHYKHASAKVRDMMRQYGQTAAAVNNRNKTTVGRNRAEVLDQGKKQQKKDQKSSGAGWIIWFIVTLAILLPKLWDFLTDWIGTNL